MPLKFGLCPGCGGEIRFTVSSSLAAVCPSCRSAVARTDRKLEDLGKVAELAESDSPLEVGLEGRWRDVRFRLTGRAQLRHSSGALWEEWYAALDDGRWGWLAEAQGKYYFTFQVPAPGKLPAFAELTLGAPVPDLPAPTPLAVQEKGRAVYAGAAGELPFRLEPGAGYAYADLGGEQESFGTLDYGSDPPLLFLGRQTSLEELGWGGLKPAVRERREGVSKLACPKCGGALELRAPDRTERVGCPYCGSLLDASSGPLAYLAGPSSQRYKPLLPLGAEAEFEGARWQVIAFLVRSTQIEGETYFWEEYLLSNAKEGFRWLVRSDEHWTFVRAVPPGAVRDGTRQAVWSGKTFKLFQDSVLCVEHVLGEVYWKVERGEKARGRDYVRAPEMLSKEVTEEGEGKGGEVNWSLGTYVSTAEMRARFPTVKLRTPGSVGACQPFPWTGLYPLWSKLLAGLLFLGLFAWLFSSRTVVLEQTFALTPAAAAAAGGAAEAEAVFADLLPPTPALSLDGPLLGGPAKGASPPLIPPTSAPPQPPAPPPFTSALVFTEPMTLSGWKNIHLSIRDAPTPLYVEGKLQDAETRRVVAEFSFPVADAEGGVYLSAVKAGTYLLALEPKVEAGVLPSSLNLRVAQGVPHPRNWFYFSLLLSAPPLLLALYQFSFERRRWAESMFG